MSHSIRPWRHGGGAGGRDALTNSSADRGIGVKEVQAPAYRIRRKGGDGPPWRMIIIAGSVLVAGAVIAALVWGMMRGSSRNAPLIEADPRPIKVRPDNPGGLRVPNQDELIFDRNRGTRTASPGGLAPETESPRVDQLRAQLAERAAQEAARNAPPPVAAAPAPAPSPAPTSPAPAPNAAPNAGAGAGPNAAAPRAASPPSQATPAAPGRAPSPPTTSALTAPSLPAPVPQASQRFAPTAQGRVQVQLGALPTESAAQSEWQRLQRRAPELLGNRRPTVTPFEREGQTPLYRLRTGGFADASTARAFCEAMRGRQIPCSVIGG